MMTYNFDLRDFDFGDEYSSPILDAVCTEYFIYCFRLMLLTLPLTFTMGYAQICDGASGFRYAAKEAVYTLFRMRQQHDLNKPPDTTASPPSSFAWLHAKEL